VEIDILAVGESDSGGIISAVGSNAVVAVFVGTLLMGEVGATTTGEDEHDTKIADNSMPQKGFMNEFLIL